MAVSTLIACLGLLPALAPDSQSNAEKRIPIPAKKNWPLFQGHRPIAAPIDQPVGDVRFWTYSFQGDWSAAVKQAAKDLTPKGYARSKERETGSDIGKPDPSGPNRLAIFSRGMYNVVSITLDDDSYAISRDTKGSGKYPFSSVRAKGWVTVTYTEPTGGMNLDMQRHRFPGSIKRHHP